MKRIGDPVVVVRNSKKIFSGDFFTILKIIGLIYGKFVCFGIHLATFQIP